ncbi:MAG: cytochrome c biogenesis protein CcsA [Bacteroidetes bacterium]|nr:cytochrome c biogenesis protein CcsA [Bacteroidota bacterium]
MGLLQAINVLQVLLPVLYSGLVITYAVSFFGGGVALERVKSPFLIATVLVHLVYLTLRTIAFDHPPITSVFEIMTVLAVCIAIAYVYIETRTHTRNTGFFILLLAFLFQLMSSFFIKDIIDIPDYLHGLVLGLHVSTALLGYTAISLSAVYALLYLMLYHDIKSSRFGVVYTRLPNLEMLETMSHKAEVFGFAMLTVGIIIGITWLPRVFDEFSYLDPKLIGTMLIWLLYAVGLAAKKQFGWQGRKTQILSLVAFGFMFLSMTVINLYLSRFHSFH